MTWDTPRWNWKNTKHLLNGLYTFIGGSCRKTKSPTRLDPSPKIAREIPQQNFRGKIPTVFSSSNGPMVQSPDSDYWNSQYYGESIPIVFRQIKMFSSVLGSQIHKASIWVNVHLSCQVPDNHTRICQMFFPSSLTHLRFLGCTPKVTHAPNICSFIVKWICVA